MYLNYLCVKHFKTMNKHKLLALIIPAFIIGCGSSDESATQNNTPDPDHARYDLSLSDKLDIFATLPTASASAANPFPDDKVKLGYFLYYDTRLSKDGKNSCNSCHNLSTFGVDNLSFSPGDKGEFGDRNSPTTLNAALHASQFWDGRAKDVEEQAGMPILNPAEMAIPSEKFLIDRLSGIDLYKEMFRKAYPNDGNPINYTNLRNAIAAFERQLITPSRFDDYLKGNKEALSIEEKKGLSSFINVGCTSCHSGELLGGKMLQKFGVHKDYWHFTNSAHIDEGLFKQTKSDFDKFVFKVPSLRNIEKTWPYFHDGSVKDLEQAVNIMAEAQLNYKLSDSETKNITAFLKSLTGEIHPAYRSAPAEIEE
jgi:cytochrome c peroxidase